MPPGKRFGFLTLDSIEATIRAKRLLESNRLDGTSLKVEPAGARVPEAGSPLPRSEQATPKAENASSRSEKTLPSAVGGSSPHPAAAEVPATGAHQGVFQGLSSERVVEHVATAVRQVQQSESLDKIKDELAQKVQQQRKELLSKQRDQLEVCAFV